MTLLPVVERELRVAARNPLTRWLRWGAVLLAGGITAAVLLANDDQSGFGRTELPKMIFRLLSCLLLGWCFLSGVVLTSDCLSSEKRRGTLGLLFLTDLSGFDVVLGKAAVASVQAFSVVVAALPVLAVPLLMGAVSFGEFWRMALALLGILGWSLSLGLLVSAMQRDSRRAVLGTLAVILVLLLAPVAATWMFWELSGRRTEPWLAVLTPLTLFAGSFESGRITPGDQQIFRLAWLALGVMTLGSLALASWLLPRRWQDSEILGGEHRAKRSRPRLGHAQPYEWLIRSTAHLPRLFNWLFVVATTVWVVLYFRVLLNLRRDQTLVTALLLLVGLHLLVKVAVAIVAAHRASDDSSSGALELLLTTPLRPRHLWRGQVEGLRWLLYRSKLVLSVMNGLLVLVLPLCFRGDSEPVFAFASALLGGIVLLWLDSRLLTEFGLLLGVVRRKHARATTEALARVLLPGWLGAFGVFLLALAGMNDEVMPVAFLGCVLWSIGVDVLQLSWVRRRLPLAFAQLAAGEPVKLSAPLQPSAPLFTGNLVRSR